MIAGVMMPHLSMPVSCSKAECCVFASVLMAMTGPMDTNDVRTVAVAGLQPELLRSLTQNYNIYVHCWFCA